MVIAAETKTYTEQEYLDLELQSEERHEYRDGAIVHMTGGTPNHSRIVLNLATMLKFSLKRQPYDIFATDQRLWIPDANRHTYPDVMMTRDPLELKPGRNDTVINPILIAEVLSKSTRDYDVGDKFRVYRTIPTFTEYLIVAQDVPRVEHHRKMEDGWLLQDIAGSEARVMLESVGVAIKFADLYDKVNFNTDVPPQ